MIMIVLRTMDHGGQKLEPHHYTTDCLCFASYSWSYARDLTGSEEGDCEDGGACDHDRSSKVPVPALVLVLVLLVVAVGGGDDAEDANVAAAEDGMTDFGLDSGPELEIELGMELGPRESDGGDADWGWDRLAADAGRTQRHSNSHVGSDTETDIAAAAAAAAESARRSDDKASVHHSHDHRPYHDQMAWQAVRHQPGTSRDAGSDVLVLVLVRAIGMEAAIDLGHCQTEAEIEAEARQSSTIPTPPKTGRSDSFWAAEDEVEVVVGDAVFFRPPLALALGLGFGLGTGFVLDLDIGRVFVHVVDRVVVVAGLGLGLGLVASVASVVSVASGAGSAADRDRAPWIPSRSRHHQPHHHHEHHHCHEQDQTGWRRCEDSRSGSAGPEHGLPLVRVAAPPYGSSCQRPTPVEHCGPSLASWPAWQLDDREFSTAKTPPSNCVNPSAAWWYAGMWQIATTRPQPPDLDTASPSYSCSSCSSRPCSCS